MMRNMVLAMAVTACTTTQHSGTEQQLPTGGNCQEQPDGSCDCQGSPLIFDLAGDGVHLSGVDDAVPFSLAGTTAWPWSWTLPGTDDAFLWLDRDRDGQVDGGAELFGDSTLQEAAPLPGDDEPRPNGFRALGVFDTNRDHTIDGSDPIWGQLKLWVDRNHDGRVTEGVPSEVTPLATSGILSISLNYRTSAGHRDAHGNEFRFSSSITVAPGSTITPTVWDVFLVAQPSPARATQVDPAHPVTQENLYATCYFWAYEVAFAGPDRSGPTIPCNGPGVSGDPTVFWTPENSATGWGPFWKLVIRHASGRVNSRDDYFPVHSMAFERAWNDVGPDCQAGNVRLPDHALQFPNPDLYRADGNVSSSISRPLFGRSACDFTEIVGGGGGGPRPTCT